MRRGGDEEGGKGEKEEVRVNNMYQTPTNPHKSTHTHMMTHTHNTHLNEFINVDASIIARVHSNLHRLKQPINAPE